MTGTITTLIKKSENRMRADNTPDRGGYGFIRDDEGHDRFFHARDLVTPDGKGGFRPAQSTFEQLKEGVKVEFTGTSGAKSRTGGGNGLRAETVRVVA